ncbi:hypothetical protein [Rhodobacteraceae bacterium DSL-40]|uniref:hypothetical protein n=1 Tax=Amaricoccus sp. B4 TaxID=3368557 RepID=UPI000DABE5F2
MSGETIRKALQEFSSSVNDQVNGAALHPALAADVFRDALLRRSSQPAWAVANGTGWEGDPPVPPRSLTAVSPNRTMSWENDLPEPPHRGSSGKRPRPPSPLPRGALW